MVRGILAVVSHPDDETFGCGGTLASHSEKGFNADVLCLSCSPRDREIELKKAVDKLGVNKLKVLDNDYITVDRKLINDVADYIVETKPRVLITHIPFDYHQEHRYTYQIVKEAVEWAGHTTTYDTPWVIEKLLLMEVNTLIPIPNIIVDISKTMKKKISAIEKYKSQLDKFNWDYYQKINMKKAELRGILGGCIYAEAFQVESIVQNSPFYTNKSTDTLL